MSNRCIAFSVFLLLVVMTLCVSAFAEAPQAGWSPVDRARALSEKGDTAAAIIELKNILQQDPGSVDVRLLLGRLYLDNGQAPEAVGELERALQSGAPREQVLVPLGRAYLLQGLHRKIITEIEIPADPRLPAAPALDSISVGWVERSKTHPSSHPSKGDRYASFALGRGLRHRPCRRRVRPPSGGDGQ